ncbi:MAG: hypothetical protein R3Y11_01040 [Pseudomonadota bacterium]
MNLVSIRRNIALFLVAIIVIVLAFRIVVAFIEVILLAICLAIIVFFGFAEDIKNAWLTIGNGIQDAYAQWQNITQKKNKSSKAQATETEEVPVVKPENTEQ